MVVEVVLNAKHAGRRRSPSGAGFAGRSLSDPKRNRRIVQWSMVQWSMRVHGPEQLPRKGARGRRVKCGQMKQSRALLDSTRKGIAPAGRRACSWISGSGSAVSGCCDKDFIASPETPVPGVACAIPVSRLCLMASSYWPSARTTGASRMVSCAVRVAGLRVPHLADPLHELVICLRRPREPLMLLVGPLDILIEDGILPAIPIPSAYFIASFHLILLAKRLV